MREYRVWVCRPLNRTRAFHIRLFCSHCARRAVYNIVHIYAYTFGIIPCHSIWPNPFHLTSRWKDSDGSFSSSVGNDTITFNVNEWCMYRLDAIPPCKCLQSNRDAVQNMSSKSETDRLAKRRKQLKKNQIENNNHQPRTDGRTTMENFIFFPVEIVCVLFKFGLIAGYSSWGNVQTHWHERRQICISISADDVQQQKQQLQLFDARTLWTFRL